jgi:hypothetical protein
MNWNYAMHILHLRVFLKGLLDLVAETVLLGSQELRELTLIRLVGQFVVLVMAKDLLLLTQLLQALLVALEISLFVEFLLQFLLVEVLGLGLLAFSSGSRRLHHLKYNYLTASNCQRNLYGYVLWHHANITMPSAIIPIRDII